MIRRSSFCLSMLAVLVAPAGGCASASGANLAASDDAGNGDAALDAAEGVVASPWPRADGGYLIGGETIREDRFATKVVDFQPGDCGGFGIPSLPGVVLGPPVGGGKEQGSLDVVSLGNGGSIVLSFEPNAIVDGPGVDFVVFENAFEYGTGKLFAEPGEVSVSDDGTTWKTFPCTATAAPYGACAGWHPVFASPTSLISPLDPARAGGDPFDLSDVGMARARFVRIVDKTGGRCEGATRSTTNGFDLDAIAIVNALMP